MKDLELFTEVGYYGPEGEPERADKTPFAVVEAVILKLPSGQCFDVCSDPETGGILICAEGTTNAVLVTSGDFQGIVVSENIAPRTTHLH